MLGAAVIILLPSAARQFAKYAGVAVSLVVLAIAVALAVAVRSRRARSTSSSRTTRGFRRSAPATSSGLDGIALALVVLTAVLVPLLLLAGWNDATVRRPARRAARRTPMSR